jgi:hypothetical protein
MIMRRDCRIEVGGDVVACLFPYLESHRVSQSSQLLDLIVYLPTHLSNCTITLPFTLVDLASRKTP